MDDRAHARCLPQPASRAIPRGVLHHGPFRRGARDRDRAGRAASQQRRHRAGTIRRARSPWPRLGLAHDDPPFILAAWPRSELREFADLHAGEAETSAMLHIAPDRVDRQLAQTLRRTNLSATQVTECRCGGSSARAATPDGYLGAPALASPENETPSARAEVEAYTKAIRAAVERGRPAGR